MFFYKIKNTLKFEKAIVGVFSNCKLTSFLHESKFQPIKYK